MFSKEFKRILELAKKTGDKIIIYNEIEPENSCLVMDIESYEKSLGLNKEISASNKEKIDNSINKDEKLRLDNNEPKKDASLDLTEEDLTDRINREISVWKNQEKPEFLSEEEKSKKPWAIPSKVKEKAKELE